MDKINKKLITLSVITLMTIQAGFEPLGRVGALQNEEDSVENIEKNNIQSSDNEEQVKEDNELKKVSLEKRELEVKKDLKPESIIPENKQDTQAISNEEKNGAEIVNQVVSLIEKSNFSEVISIFSNSLYADVPERDESEGQKYELTDLEKTYNNKIKTEVRNIAELIVSVNSFDVYDEKTVKKQLILLTYLMRWGTFSDQSTFWKALYIKGSSLFTDEEIIRINQQFIRLFEENPSVYLGSKYVNHTFETVYKAINKDWTYKKSVEEFLSQEKKIVDYSDWFYKMFPGTVYKDHYQGTSYDVGIWNRGKTFDSFLPYLLTQSQNSNLMIGETRGEIIFTTPTNYDNDNKKAETVLLNAMTTITNILELYDRTIENKELLNVDKILGLRATLDQGRKWLNPNDSLSYELYRLAGFTKTHGGSGAIGGAGQIVMQGTKLDSPGTVAHELGHELNSLFNAGSEFYTTYLDNPGRQKGLYVNVYEDGKKILKGEDSLGNSSSVNFQSKSDLVNYTRNMEDAAYLLDIAVAKSVLSLPLEEQAKYIKIAYVNGENGALNTEIENPDTNQVKDLSVEELKKLNIQSIDDLVDNNAVIMENKDTNKNILRNHGQGYGTTLTYSAFFLSNGKPYHHNHRILNTLLAHNGWEAFKTFNVTYEEEVKAHEEEGLSNDEIVGKASLAALRKAYNDDSLTYRDLIKQRYNEVQKKAESKGLLDKSYEEFISDFSSSPLDNFYETKLRTVTRYLSLSQEFSKSIFGLDESLITEVSSYTELYETIASNPRATISLTKDIKVEGKYAGQALPEFHGVFDGRGHTISEATHALFYKIEESEVKNLIITGSQIHEIDKGNAGGLSNVAISSSVKNVHFTKSKIVLEGENDLKPNVGGIFGDAFNSQILESSVQEVALSGRYVGGIVGRSNNTSVLNAYTTGEVANTNSRDIRIGGIIGNGYNHSSVTNAYTTMNIQGGNGILGSDYDYGNTDITINNTLSLANILSDGKYKIYEGTPQQQWANNYEVDELSGQSSIGIDNIDAKSVLKKQINTEFFEKSLQFDKEPIWETTKADSENNLPMLKNDDPRYKHSPIKGGNVTVHYQDESGNKIADDVVLEGNIDDTYTSVEQNITGYTLKEIKGDPSGKFTEDAQTVSYIYTENVVHPIDPTHPDMNHPITPEDPEEHDKPTSGSLSIDYISNLRFGEQKITGADTTYHAQLDQFTDSKGEAIARPNFIQITDVRDNKSGWRLTVTQDKQFQNENEELTGAVLKLNNAILTTPNDGVPPIASNNIALTPGSSTDILEAKTNQGTGTWLNRFGKDEEEGKLSISLSVPGETKKVQGEYKTSLTWILTDSPL